MISFGFLVFIFCILNFVYVVNLVVLIVVLLIRRCFLDIGFILEYLRRIDRLFWVGFYFIF